MIYVIQSNGKGQGKADTIKLLIFPAYKDAFDHIDINERRNSDGHKHWTRFDIVEPEVTVENYSN
jgi:hypothetical protein